MFCLLYCRLCSLFKLTAHEGGFPGHACAWKPCSSSGEPRKEGEEIFIRLLLLKNEGKIILITVTNHPSIWLINNCISSLSISLLERKRRRDERWGEELVETIKKVERTYTVEETVTTHDLGNLTYANHNKIKRKHSKKNKETNNRSLLKYTSSNTNTSTNLCGYQRNY